MSDENPTRHASARPWTQSAMTGLVVTVAIAGTLLGLLSHEVNSVLEYRRSGLESLQLWRLLTAHLAHLDFVHGALNGAALLLVWRIVRDFVSPTECAWLLVGSITTIDAGLYLLSPAVEWYVGASGALHGLLAGAAVLMLDRGARVQGVVVLLAVGAKLVLEQAGGGALTTFMLGDAPVVAVAHLYGAAGGIVTAAMLYLARRAPHAT